MPKAIEGNLDGKGCRIAIVVSRFNDFVTARLLDGALDALVRHGVADGDITVVRVPGALEIPPAAGRLLERCRGKEKSFSAIIALGAVIRGETPHFDYVAAEVGKGLAQLALEGVVPVINAVLTTDTVPQAVDRAGAKGGNKGFTAAMNAIEMASVLRSIETA
jgi:6,7-dimethyl-8-ribityllumazine synthase